VPATLLPDTRLPSAARRASPPALAQGHELGIPLWRDERAIALSRPAFEDPACSRDRAGLERAVAPAQPSWRWFRPGGGWFHREMDELLAGGPYRWCSAPISPGPLRPPLWFMPPVS